jgi:hypothetical protein
MTQASRLTDHPDPLIRKMMGSLEAAQGIAYGEFKGAFDRLNRTIREVGAKNQVLVIDLAGEIPPIRDNICDVAHFTDQGSRLVAARIVAGLMPVIVSLPKKPLSGDQK